MLWVEMITEWSAWKWKLEKNTENTRYTVMGTIYHDHKTKVLMLWATSCYMSVCRPRPLRVIYGGGGGSWGHVVFQTQTRWVIMCTKYHDHSTKHCQDTCCASTYGPHPLPALPNPLSMGEIIRKIWYISETVRFSGNSLDQISRSCVPCTMI